MYSAIATVTASSVTVYQSASSSAKKLGTLKQGAEDNLLKVSGSMVSDCTVNQLEALGTLLEECTVNPIRYLEGEAVQGEEYIEFYVDEDSLQDTVMDLFYREA